MQRVYGINNKDWHYMNKKIKLFVRENFPFLIGAHHFWVYVMKRFVAPRRRKAYGYFGSTTYLWLPALVENPRTVFLYEDVHIRHGLTVINTCGKVVVKKYTGIAPDCTIVTGNHTPTVGVPQRIGGPCHVNDNEKGVTIDEGVWIGTRVTLLAGAHVGRGAVIGAQSLVNKEIPPYAVAVGSPAKVIASVFTIDQILEHERRLYKPEERFTREYLEELFAKHYEGKKSIGKSSMSEEDKQKVKAFSLRLYNHIVVD